MKAQDIEISDMSSAFITQEVALQFKVVAYDFDTISEARYAAAPDAPFRSPAGADSGHGHFLGRHLHLRQHQPPGAEGYGGGNFADDGHIPYVIEVKGSGEATLYLPNMLAMCDNNRFDGLLVRMRLLDLP
jgi:hypothetical protein